MKFIISGGKTGGHLIPGIAVYKEAKKRGIVARYILSDMDYKFTIIDQIDKFDRLSINIGSISRKLSFKTPIYILKIFSAFLSIIGSVKRFNPDAVIISGGYVSNPVALSAVLLGKPLFIIEQNSVAGVTNRFYSRFARLIFTSIPGTKKIPLHKAILTGNPTLYSNSLDKTEAKKFFGMEGYDRIIGITGGSQGASLINNQIFSILPEIKSRNIGIIWSLGAVGYNIMENAENEAGKSHIEIINSVYPNVKALSFIERMDYFLSACDIIISRAGATSVSEFIAFEKPALFIPIKNSPDNHQLYNAKFLHNYKTAEIIEEDDLSNETLLYAIMNMLENAETYKKGYKKIKKIYAGKTNITENIINLIIDNIS